MLRVLYLYLYVVCMYVCICMYMYVIYILHVYVCYLCNNILYVYDVSLFCICMIYMYVCYKVCYIQTYIYACMHTRITSLWKHTFLNCWTHTSTGPTVDTRQTQHAHRLLSLGSRKAGARGNLKSEFPARMSIAFMHVCMYVYVVSIWLLY